MPPDAELVSVARILMRGVLVAIGSTDEVDRARQRMSGFDNSMFLDASPVSVPWRDAYFTKIVVPPELSTLSHQLAPEIARLLAPDGQVIHTGVNA